jgi:hypothetical protein
MDANELAHAAGGRGACVGSGFHRPDIAAHNGRHEARVDLLPADEHDIRGFAHRVGRLDHPDEAACFDHAERVADLAFVFVSHSSDSHYTSITTFTKYTLDESKEVHMQL